MISKFQSLLTYCSVFQATVLIQSLHTIEHLAQVYEIYGLKIPEQNAHGLIGTFDVESIHFVFDLWLTLSFYILIFGFPDVIKGRKPSAYKVLVAGAVIQTYHMFEHFVRFTQHVHTGDPAPPGLIGLYLNIPVFHLIFNLFSDTTLLYVFISLAVWKQCFPRTKYKAATPAVMTTSSL